MNSLYPELERSMRMTEEQLLVELGRTISGQASAFGEDDKKSQAENWFAGHKRLLKERICPSLIVQAIRRNPGAWSDVLIMAAIADLINSFITGVSPVTVAAILVKRGLESLCD